MFTFMFFCHVWLLHTAQTCGTGNSTAVIQFSVPEDHHIRLLCCDGSDSSDVVWTHQDRKVLVTRQGDYETNEDSRRFLLLSDGSLSLLRLDDSDDGEYRCNQRLVATLQVLKGPDFWVSAGRTLLLPCSSSSKSRLRWFHRNKGGRRELLFTWFRNGTTRPERDGSRLRYDDDALHIQDLQPEDRGQYQCSGRPWATVTILAVHPETTSIQQTTSTSATRAVMKTDVVETKEKEEKEEEVQPENALLIAAVVGSGLMILLMAAVCALLTSMRCKRRMKKDTSAAAPPRPEDNELQPWTTSGTQTESPSLPEEEETVHYASLGRQNWRERPSRTLPDQIHHSVIYSSVITRPAGK